MSLSCETRQSHEALDGNSSPADDSREPESIRRSGGRGGEETGKRSYLAHFATRYLNTSVREGYKGEA